MRKFFAIFSLCLIVTFFSHADVFTLWPTGGAGKKNSSADPEQLLDGKQVWNENVTINGIDLELNIAVIVSPVEDLLFQLNKAFPEGVFAASSNTILIKNKLNGGWEKRILIIFPGEGFPAIMFTMNTPEKFPEKFNWPEMLPMTGDGKPLKYMQFHKRDTFYGEYKTINSPAAALSEVSAKLRADGWSPYTGEQNSENGGSGEIFLKTRPKSLMLINFSSNGVATVMTRPAK
jgi:hypothetical protein